MQPQLINLLRQNRMPEAKAVCAQLCKAHPNNAQLLFTMSAICGQLGEFSESAQHCQHAIQLNPNVPEAWYNLAAAQLRLGQDTAASDSLQRALKLRPDFPEALAELGNLYQRKERHTDAIPVYQRAIQLRPNFADAYYNLAVAQIAARNTAEALENLQKALALNPNLAAARFLLGKSLAEKGDYISALEQLKKATSLAPTNIDYLNTIATVHRDAGQPDQAAAYFRTLLNITPDNAKILSNYGLALIDLHDTDEAIVCLTRAAELDPKLAEARYNLGIALGTANRQTEAECAYLEALKLRSDFPEAWMNLSTLHLLQGRQPEAIRNLEQVLQLRPDHPEAASNLLMTLNYTEAYTDLEIAKRHRDWGDGFASVYTKNRHTPMLGRRNHSMLRIGFVSPDFRAHSVAWFFQSLLGHGRPEIQIFCYSNTDKPDQITQQIRDQVDQWRDITKLTDADAAKFIHEDALDVLIDLAGHTRGNRLGIFALQPSPVQISYLGYPNTTGLPTIDYRITDNLADPGRNQLHYSETLLRMERCFVCYTPQTAITDPTAIGRSSDRPITFGSFNNLAKLNPQLIESWAKILLHTPDTRLMLKCRPLADDQVAERYRQAFQQHGIGRERLQFVGWLPDIDHLLAYNQIDIALDTYPYNGTTTTCEALWMGRPVVTLTGTRHASRVGASLLTAVGLTDLITQNTEDYVSAAVKLANVLCEDNHHYHDIRTRMQSSTLCDRTNFQRHFFTLIERALEPATHN